MRNGRRILIFGAALLGMSLIPASPAAADAFYPSSCFRQANNGNWVENCYLGIDGNRYQNRANFITGTQRILRGSGYSPGPSNDGIFGSQTRNAVLAYQQSSSAITIDDGVVGPQTWQHFYDYKVIFVRPEGGTDLYRVFGSSSVSLRERVSELYDPWDTRNTNNSSWVPFDTSGPA